MRKPTQSSNEIVKKEPKKVDSRFKRKFIQEYVMRPVRETERHILEMNEREANARKRKEEAEAQLIKDKEAIASQDYEAEIEKEMAMLEKHHGVAKVRLVERMIAITTKPMFAEIRTGAGLRTKKRALLGYFTLFFSPFNGPYLENHVFGGSRGHWASNDRGRGTVCLGEYSNPLMSMMGDHIKIYEAFDMMYHFIRTCDDSAAYERDYQWRDNRVRSLPNYNNRGIRYLLKEEWKTPIASSELLSSQDKVVALSNIDGFELVGERGIVYATHGYGENEEVVCMFPYARGGMNLRVPKRILHKLTDEEYQSPLENQFSTLLDKLDALPDSVTVGEIQSIMGLVSQEETHNDSREYREEPNSVTSATLLPNVNNLRAAQQIFYGDTMFTTNSFTSTTGNALTTSNIERTIGVLHDEVTEGILNPIQEIINRERPSSF